MISTWQLKEVERPASLSMFTIMLLSCLFFMLSPHTKHTHTSTSHTMADRHQHPPPRLTMMTGGTGCVWSCGTATMATSRQPPGALAAGGGNHDTRAAAGIAAIAHLAGRRHAAWGGAAFPVRRQHQWDPRGGPQHASARLSSWVCRQHVGDLSKCL